MADFVAVLRKTLDGLTDPTPQMREKVYEKARATIAGKLAVMNPPPAAGVVERQKRALEDAILEIERGYSPLPPPQGDDPLAELENVFASLKSPDPLAVLKDPAKTGHPPLPPLARDAPVPFADPSPASAANGNGRSTGMTSPPLAEEDDEDDSLAIPDGTERQRSRAGGLALAAVAVLALVGAGYGVWINRDAFGSLLGTQEEASVSPPDDSEPQPAAPDTSTPATETPAAEGAATEPPATEPPAVTPDPAPAVKFTQRLNSDGTEVDEGPAGVAPVIGEGTSIAAVTQPALTQPPLAAPPETAQPEAPDAESPPAPDAAGTEPSPADTPPSTEAAPAPAATPSDPIAPTAGAADASVPVGQRAIFYEERTNVAEASAEPGSIVWSLVQESPGADLPPEPAIRAEATIPGKDMQLRMTIRRNADRSLPASHIVEMIFLTPAGFEGGGIETVLRLSLKGSEQEAGSPLLGIPAKIADGFFLIALNDTKPEIDANTALMRRQSWIDVPVQYKSGRRALFTMEKGIPGAKVFDEALKAWQAASSG